MADKTCASCERSLPETDYPDGGESSICRECELARGGLAGAGGTAFSTADLPTLETVTIEAVEVLAEGGPYFGTGSPPEGDYFDRAYLEAVAAANNELAGEVKPANKIGHSKEQKLLANSGLSIDEMPAAGWLENFRVADGEDGKARVVADVKDCPKKLATLIKAKAFRTRSSELSKITSGGKVYSAVITGLAWLGAKAPAIRTLDDVLALYATATGGERQSAARLMYADAAGPTSIFAADGIDAEIIRLVDFAVTPEDAQLVWDSEDGCYDLMDDISRALNGPSDWSYRYWVRDLIVDEATGGEPKSGRALVMENDGDAAWVVPWTIDGNDEPVPAVSTEWILAEQGWVATATSSAESVAEMAAVTESGSTVDTPPMPETTTKSKFSDEQITTFATALGIDEKDDAARRAAVEKKLAEDLQETPAPPDPDPAPPTPPEPTATGKVELTAVEVAGLRQNADLGAKAHEDRRVEKRETALSLAVKEGRLDRAKLDEWRGYYDDNEAMTVVMLSELRPDPDLLAVYGADADGLDAESRGAEDDRLYAAFAPFLGVEIPTTQGA